MTDIEYGRRESGARSVWIVITVGVLAAGGIAVWSFARQPRPVPVPAELPPIVAAPAPAPVTALPSVEESDAQLRAAFGDVSFLPLWKSWLGTSDLLTRFVASVDALSEGRVARRQLEFLAPKGRFVTREANGGEFADARAFARYDAFATVVGSLDAARVATAYRTLEPLLTAGYRAFGYPDRRIDDAVRPALAKVLEIPLVDGGAALVAKGGVMRYVDPAMEGASDLQKQVWRFGPHNQKVVQDKARELAAALGLPKS